MKLTLENKIIISICIATAALLSVIFLLFKNFETVKSTSYWVNHTNEVLITSDTVLTDALTIETDVRGYVITNDVLFLDSYNQAINSLLINVSQLATLTSDNPNQRLHVDSLRKMVEEKVELTRKGIVLIKQKALDENTKIDIAKRSKKYTDNIRKQIAEINSEENRLLFQRKLANSESTKKTETILLLLRASIFIILILMAVLVLRNEKTRNKSELELKKSHDLFFSIFDLNPIPTQITAVSSRKFKYVNEAFLNLLIFKKEEVIGKTAIEIKMMNQETSFRIRDYMAEHNGRMNGEEFIFKNSKGETFDVMAYSVIIDFDGKPHYMTTMLDISERKKAEERVKTYAILESKSKEMEQFTYITSHDLREPLLTIKNFIELFIENYGRSIDENGRQLLQFIDNSAKRMDTLIRSLMDYSRLSKPKEIKDVNCSALVQEVLDELRLQIVKTEARIKVEDLPIVNGYPMELKLLFQNLISNAIKFKKENVAPEINISWKKVRKGWQFTIKDNGIGIEEHDKERIYLIF